MDWAVRGWEGGIGASVREVLWAELGDVGGLAGEVVMDGVVPSRLHCFLSLLQSVRAPVGSSLIMIMAVGLQGKAGSLAYEGASGRCLLFAACNKEIVSSGTGWFVYRLTYFGTRREKILRHVLMLKYCQKKRRIASSWSVWRPNAWRPLKGFWPSRNPQRRTHSTAFACSSSL